ncbi:MULTISPECIES: nucleotidyltransferase family protein [unclassified Nocardioides]|uniref:nucleotidyltransferase family protein n=1 Tax=unclassified Nocardioides TaxID=2615069 RepID=UPI0006FCDAC1|nr:MULTISPECIES: nucleotidyltransferase family protein [unclassified Nocardioides]KQY50248.1 nucleotidyl transferase [Nocardioides sp. Root140]KQZ75873.1 nucleotidyl transferase [Nocardioides sp. Root151]
MIHADDRIPRADVGSTLLEAIAVIDRGALGICCLVDDAGRLQGVLTDGDTRRALIAGHPLTAPAIDHATASPHTVVAGTPRAHVLDLMHAWRVSAIPEVDAAGLVHGVHALSDVIGPPDLPNVAVIMAGGKGTRLGDLTRHVPKPLMTVAGRPIIDWIILGLVGDGIRKIHVSVNHLADQIIDHVGDGRRLGAEVGYLREDPETPLGTGGSLALLRDRPTEPMLVMNGDLMVDFDAQQLLRFHTQSQSRITVGVRQYSHTVPFGVVEHDAEHRIQQLVEKPDLTVSINTGVYCIDPDLIGLVPPDTMSHMPDLVQRCLDDGQRVSAWELSSDWIDVGTPADLARAKGAG